MNASEINVYQFNPKTCTATIAKWRLGHFVIFVQAARARKKLSDEARDAIMSVLAQAGSVTESDLQLLSATSDASGSDDNEIDMLGTIMIQFWEALAPDVQAQVPRPLP